MPLLLDTTVYIDRSAGKLPRAVAELIAARQHLIHHCGIVSAELAISIGLLDPAHERTSSTIAAIAAHLDRMETQRAVAPSAATWTEAAVLAGLLARTLGLAAAKRTLTGDQECCQRGRRRELLLDALLYMTALERGMRLVTGNIRHLDALLQLRPSGNVLLYRRLA